MDTLLLIDKPSGITSFGVIAKLRRILGEKKIGHAGTLDPLATGLLLIGVGKQTKQLTSLVGLDKSYTADILLGTATDTFDMEGAVTQETPDAIPPTIEDIQRALAPLTGTYIQRAPLFSAKKIGGKKLYDLARSGKATEDMRPQKQITVEKIDIISYAYPHLIVDISCSSGTYIRTIADDLGRALGMGGCLYALRRTRIGSYFVTNAKTLTRLSLDIPLK